VIGTCSKENAVFARQLGADVVIDYKNENFEDMVSDIDLVFDTIGGETQKRSVQVIKNGGKLITTLKPEFRDEANGKNIHLEGFSAQSYPNDLKKIAELIDSGHIKPAVTKIMPLEQAAEAEKLNAEGHTRGKIVLKVA
jgi:NADPH:quinone reductase-like Zn-dependent oxidoreductase